MSAEKGTTHGARRSARALSPLAVALGLAATAAVAAGGAWMGYAGQPVGARAVPSAPPATAPAASAAWAPRPDAPAPEVQVLLDGGNAAFRAGRYDVALEHYRTATQRAPGDAAPWYGIHMAAQKLGRPGLADSAMAAIRARTADPTAWDDGAVRQAHAGARGGQPAASAPGGR